MPASRRAPGLYVHVPFCAKVCPYCDFAVQTGGPKKRRAYLDALRQEIRRWGAGEAAWDATAAFDTVYLGGGTPSSLDAEQLAQVIGEIRASLRVAADAEITLEANPEDVGCDRLAAWRELGVSRVSLGVQSFDDATLQVLGRSHSAAEAIEAVERVSAAGFDAVSLDLIFAVSAQSPESWRATLQRAVALQPQHISCYELTIHEGTRFFRARQRGRFAEAPDERKADQFFFTHGFLADAGYPAYEVSNFAPRAELQSRHNLKYWDHSPYLGIGPSAHSFDGTADRWWNERRLDKWIAAVGADGVPVAGTETLAPAQLVLEALALGLRTTAGVDATTVEECYGIDMVAANAPLIDDLRRRGLLEDVDSLKMLIPTLEGMAIADTLAAAFRLPADA